jgi:hypothetical protein
MHLQIQILTLKGNKVGIKEIPIHADTAGQIKEDSCPN